MENSFLHLINNGGTAGSLIRTKNWANTSMGRAQEWPTVLINQLNFLLNCNSPMFLLWGEQLLFFGNDALFETGYFNNKQSQQLIGESTVNVFGKSWAQIEPIITRILQGDNSLIGHPQNLFFNSENGEQPEPLNTLFCGIYNEWGKVAGVLAITDKNHLPSTSTFNRLRLPEIEEKISKLNSIVQSSDDAIITMNMDGTITSWNESAERIFGYNSAEMVGFKSTATLPADKNEEAVYLLSSVNMGQKISNLITRRLHKSGSVIDVAISVSPIFDTKGTIKGLSKIVRDITYQKRNEQLIIENEERLQLVLSVSDLGTWELDLQTNEIRYSKKYLEILGYKEPQAFTHAELLKHVYPDDWEVRERAMKNAVSEGVLNYEFRLMRHDGSLRWIEAKGQVFYDNEKKPAKLIGTFRDITERRHRVDELRESEQKFRILADSVPQLIWTGDTNGNLNYFNLSLFEYTGLTPKQIHKDGWIQIVHPDDRLESVKQWAAAINEGVPFLTEHRFRRYDGEYRWHLSRALPQKDALGQTQMWVGTSTDVHDQKVFSEELEKNVQARTIELKNAIKELVKTNQELEQFAYVSSHDLQEPLRKIQTFSGILSSGKDISSESRIYLDKINASASRMSELIKDLLNYSRLSKKEALFSETDLNLVLDKVKNDFEVLIQQKKAIVLSTRLPLVKAIPIQMNQLIYNLIGNALKFCDQKPFIEISSKKASPQELSTIQGANDKGNYHHLMFKDNGIGFSQEYAQQIFTIFQRLNDIQKYSGTGIGLAMCKKIAENHNGFIKADSAPGKGSTFHVFLPY
ncbi:MAG: PAS domain S-box protein [Bacteroidia bacterium]|nr:PAS domain S-box protein [Bacteroidia bacterium]